MNDIEVSSIDLVEGGNIFKQGHYLTLGYVPRDEKGETVDLSGKTLNVSLWGRKGVVFEAAATYSAGVIRFTLDKMVPAGDYTVEFTVTSSTDAKYRKKFPTNQHSGRIAIKQSADDLGVVGIQVYTVAQLKAEQKAIQTQYESTVDAKVQASDAKSATALTKSTTAEATANDVKSQFEQVVISGDSSVEAAAARVAPDQTFVSLKARLDAKEQATAAQLAETDNKTIEVKKNINKEVLPKQKKRVPMMTFVDDDGQNQVLTKWEPILEEKKSKLTVALVTSWVEGGASTVMGWNTIHRLKDTYGVEFVNHTHDHLHGNDISEAQIHAEYAQSSEILLREGLNNDILVQPFGENTEPVRRISRDYFRANVATKEGINYPPLDTYRLNRITLAEETNNTLAYYKSKIDEAVANKGWIIFKSHSQYPAFDATQIQHIKDIIDYARSLGVAEVTLHEGLDRVGNIIDIGDYTLRDDASSPEYTVMDYQGVIHSKTNSKDYYTRKFNSASATTPLETFPRKAVTMDTIVGSNATGFPENRAGTLETYKTESAGNSFQMYSIYDSDNEYRRRWDATNNVWLPFVKVGQEIKETFLNIVINGATIPAQSSTDIVLTNTAAKLLDYIQGVPRAAMTSGIMYNVFIRADNEIVVRYFNATAASIAVPTLRFNFRIVKL